MEMFNQLIDRSKSFFYLHEKTLIVVIQKLRIWIGITQGKLTFTYLGCPIFYGRRKFSYFQDIIVKVNRR